MLHFWTVLALAVGSWLTANGGDASVSPALLTRGGERVSWLAPGEEHVYEASLRQAEFLHVLIDQMGVDVTVTVEDPWGATLTVIDHPHGRDRPESVAVVATSAGLFRLIVRPYRTATEPGDYRLTVEAWRPATAVDRLRADAERATQAAHRHADLRTEAGLRAAVAGYVAARPLWRSVGDRAGEARLVRRLGQTHRRLGEYVAAGVALDDALALERARSNHAGVASTLNELGLLRRRTGDQRGAIEAFRQALALWRELEDPARVGRVHNNLAAALQAVGESDAALAHYQRALDVARRLGDRLREASALINLGHLHDHLGALDQAAASYEAARPLTASLGRPDLEADVLQQLGSTLDQLGEWRAALDHHATALAVYQSLGDQRRQAASLASQGRLLIELGQPADARARLEAALVLLRLHADPQLESRVLLSLGAAARDLDDSDGALSSFALARTVATEAGDRDAEAWAIYHEATIHAHRGPPVRAGDMALRALAGFREVGNARGEVVALRVVGRMDAAQGRDDAARRAFEQALAKAEAIGDATERARSRHALGRWARDRGRLVEASGHLDQALADFESVRLRIAGDTLRASHFASVREAYELAIDVLMLRHADHPGAGFDQQALAVSQRARARGLNDGLRRAGVDLAPDDPDWRAREQVLRRALNTLAAQSRRGDLAGTDRGIEDRVASLTAEYRLLEGRAASLTAEYRLLEGRAVSLPSVARTTLDRDAVSALLGPDTVLLEWLLAEPRSYLWVVTKSALTSAALPGRAEIERLAERALEFLSQPGGDRAARRDALAALSQAVLSPAFGQLGRMRWVIVADGPLHRIPFAALPVPERHDESPDCESLRAVATVPLVAGHEVVSVPSVAVLDALRGRARERLRGSPMVFADPVYTRDDPRIVSKIRSVAGHVEPFSELPRLVGSDREASAIVSAISSVSGDGTVRVVRGVEAHREQVLSADVASASIVHFATHAVVDAEHPALSGLALSRYDAAGEPRESFVRLHDIYPLRWRADLVVLSACRGASGRAPRGEGAMSLARGFLHAGATRVVASLWPVRDQATAELMGRFYRGLFRDRLTPPAALAAAQRSMSRDRRWRDPAFWAGFVVVGDWSTLEPAS